LNDVWQLQVANGDAKEESNMQVEPEKVEEGDVDEEGDEDEDYDEGHESHSAAIDEEEYYDEYE